LLAFARQQVVSPRVLDLNGTIEALQRMLARLIGEDLALRFRPGEALWNVRMDPSQVDQVVINLAANARDAIHDVGSIAIETSNVYVEEDRCRTHPGAEPGEYVRLAVSDTGEGIDEATRARIFEPFFTTKPEGKGTGLGLATVYGIVTQAHGFLEVRSEPGHGTTFEVYLPRCEAAPERPVAVDDLGPPGGTETVLVVEDEPALLEIVRLDLEALGYTVLQAGSPSEAIAVCQAHPGDIHLLLTDVVMPEMNGEVLRERLSALEPRMKTVLMSGYTADALTDHGVGRPDLVFLAKPFSFQELGVKVRQALLGPPDGPA
jgi:CheY-like chemotaxis protein